VLEVMAHKSYTAPEKSHKNNAHGALFITSVWLQDKMQLLPYKQAERPMAVQPAITDLISQKIKWHVTGYNYIQNEDATCTLWWFVS
jgi:bifunctional pyridoxal-dependent enzyme with beta-cystathionase and maltose regulon repressor activities